jgi:hypothetical protein
MDIKQHNKDIKDKIAELSPMFPDDTVLVTSILNRERNSTPGRTVEVSVFQASKLTVENTHRLATPDEVEAYKAHCANEQKRIEQAELRRSNQRLRILK